MKPLECTLLTNETGGESLGKTGKMVVKGPGHFCIV